jgi:hypothetical protein
VPDPYTFGAESQVSNEGVDVSLVTLELRYGVEVEADFFFELDTLHMTADWLGG